MGKDCGRSNERLDTKALTEYDHVAEGEVGGSENSSRLFGLRISFEMPQIQENGSLNKETLRVVIHNFIMHLTFHNEGYVTHAFWNFAALT